MATGWGKLTWGANNWGDLSDTSITLTGISLTTTLGNESISIDVAPVPTGQTLTTVVDDLAAVTGTTSAYPTGQAATMTLASVDAGPDAMLTGIAMSAALGSVEAYNQEGWGRQGWGENAWGVEGTWISTTVSGIAMTATLDSVTPQADATITANTLSIAQVTLGVVDPAPDAMITGNFMIGALGTLGTTADANVSLTGIAMTAALASVTADANTIPTITGIAMTAALGTGTIIKIHTDATPTGFGLTMTLNSASALIWNEVDTGSAPLDPPGWVNVAA
jgi:hypothetical protein